MATRKGLEPSTSGVTGRRSNRLSYRAISFKEITYCNYLSVVEVTGLEPVTLCL